jgi:type I restriction enzyme S subunit
MKRWPTKLLDELSETIMGQAPPGNESNFDGKGTPFVKAGEFGKSRPIIREWTTKPLRHAKSSDVLVCVVGATCGKLNLGVDCAIGRSVAAIRPNASLLNQEYLYAFLQGWTLKLRSGSQGSAQGVITRDMLATIPIPVPPLAEQERIVKLLNEAGELRELRAQADNRTSALLPALFNEMFGDPQTNPNGWNTQRFVDACVKPPNNGIFKKVDEYGTGTPVVWVEELYGGLKIDTRNCRRLRTNEDDIASYGLRHGDILFCRSSLVRAGIGQASFYDGEDNEVLFECHVIRFSPNLALVSPEYVTAFFRHPHGKSELMRVAKTATMTTIGQKDIAVIKIPLPPVALQKEFAKRVAEISELETMQIASRQRLKALFQSMLHQAFNGEL